MRSEMKGRREEFGSFNPGSVFGMEVGIIE